MLPLQIKRRRNSKIDPKLALRAHIDQLPLAQQRAFVELALQVVSQRNAMPDSEQVVGHRNLMSKSK